MSDRMSRRSVFRIVWGAGFLAAGSAVGCTGGEVAKDLSGDPKSLDESVLKQRSRGKKKNEPAPPAPIQRTKSDRG